MAEWADKGKMINQNAKWQYEYARSALKPGLQQQAAIGAYPLKFSLTGCINAHTSLPAVDKNNFWGDTSKGEPKAGRMLDYHLPFLKNPLSWQTSPSGYAAVWVTENTGRCCLRP